jgi:large subunit ribosomal protein L19
MNSQQILDSVVASQLKPATQFPPMSVGDTINVHVRIIEGEKERIQVYQGVFIAQRGRGLNRMITVRRIVANEGVERIFPLHSPRIARIEIVRKGDARRAKLYYLRNRVGKSRRLRDQRRGLKHFLKAPGETVTAEADAATGAPMDVESGAQAVVEAPSAPA